jgi:hypothetical protein
MNSTIRTANKVHRCGGCEGWIYVGEQYWEHTDFPGSDVGYATQAGHPVTMAECRFCAERYGRPIIQEKTKKWPALTPRDATKVSVAILKARNNQDPGPTLESCHDPVTSRALFDRLMED